MASSAEDDNQQYFILGLAAGVITLVLLLVFGVALMRGNCAECKDKQPAALAAAAPATAGVAGAIEEAIPEGASVRISSSLVVFYFASGSTDLVPNANEAMKSIVRGVKGGKKVVISGFHDVTGDAAQNEELALHRAQKVQEMLVGLGVPADKIVLQKPEATTGSGSNAQARRVEVRLVD